MNTHATLLTIFVVTFAALTSASPRNRRQAGIFCQQPNGVFPMDGDCHRFISCYEGAGSIQACPDRLVFNPASGRCDRVSNVPECANVGLPANTLCQTNPGITGESWKVAHPDFCNAFLTCEEGYIHRRCEFCGEGTIFSAGTGNCVSDRGIDVNQVCAGKQMVAHADVEMQKLSNECNLFVPTNPFLEIANNINGGNRNFGGQQQPRLQYQVAVPNRAFIPYSVPLYYVRGSGK